ncbi:hypothetical protein SDRG_13034, partial [Saprolegnia diclina VS20]
MTAHLAKLDSILDNCAIDQQHPSPVDPTHERSIACLFTVLEDPTFFDKLHWTSALKKAETRVLVRLDKGCLTYLPPSAASPQYLPTMHTCFVRHGKRQVQLVARGSDVIKTFAFASPLQATEFCGAVHLLQHLDHLRQPRYLPKDSDPELYKQLHYTLEFATDMWTQALWQQLWPYSRLLELLASGLSLLRKSQPTPSRSVLKQLLAILDEVHDDFFPHASLRTMSTDETRAMLDDVKCYRASYVALLVGKIQALTIHVELYLHPVA